MTRDRDILRLIDRTFAGKRGAISAHYTPITKAADLIDLGKPAIQAARRYLLTQYYYAPSAMKVALQEANLNLPTCIGTLKKWQASAPDEVTWPIDRPLDHFTPRYASEHDAREAIIFDWHHKVWMPGRLLGFSTPRTIEIPDEWLLTPEVRFVLTNEFLRQEPLYSPAIARFEEHFALLDMPLHRQKLWMIAARCDAFLDRSLILGSLTSG